MRKDHVNLPDLRPSLQRVVLRNIEEGTEPKDSYLARWANAFEPGMTEEEVQERMKRA